MMMRLGLIAGSVLAAALAYTLPEAPATGVGFALLVLIGLLWLTEALPLTFTALMVPVLGVALGLSNINAALAGFAHPVVALFLGGFALAAALGEHGIDRWLAQKLLLLAGGRALPAVLLLSLTTALLSMWISNTATTAMLLPIALGMSAPLADQYPRYRVFLLLALAWSANIGGMATLVGSPPNAIAAAALEWSFNEWLAAGVPVFLVLFPIALLVLFFICRPEANLPRVDTLSRVAFPSTLGARMTLAIFLLTVMLWVLGAPLADVLAIEKGFDTWVAVLAIVLLGVTRCVTWAQVEQHANWGVLLLFGGGITLSTLLQSSGASAWLAEGMSGILPEGHPWLVYLILGTFIIFLTEVASNTASAALLVPLLMPVGATVGADPVAVALLVAFGASCAFMLPVATPPNAMVYGSGHVPQKTMIRAGVILNVIAALVLSVMVPWLP
ncbi:SLC13 family permease [Alcanivorax sediminis]|uniref:DASS family sodium-coupled anion symporter n=1 Tax=Alcanivorax sediminis TaxID=2663008 RepID=A0A6N7LZ57_9GAMM|nr:SLC13 family permease [Alcanivorax sediminis]MQX53541.1 DASS family sodium-coupled anion symporter [Alcanivorax sediminis]